MNIKELNRLLAQVEKMPETMSQKSLNLSISATEWQAAYSEEKKAIRNQRVSEATKAAMADPKVKDALKKSLMGRVPSNKGKKMSAEQVEKLKAAHKRRQPVTDETKAKLRAAQARRSAKGPRSNGRRVEYEGIVYASSLELSRLIDVKPYLLPKLPTFKFIDQPQKSEHKNKPCSIDDLRTVYKSMREMRADIGHSKKAGCEAPSFRYLTDEEKTAWIAAGMPRHWKML